MGDIGGATPEQVQWHRRVAVEQFNATWDLIDDGDRSDAAGRAMLVAAMTSRWHWGQVGGAEETAAGDWLIAHVFSLLGHGELALRFARSSLDTAQTEGSSGWRLASAHEGVARACAVLGDRAGRLEHVEAATTALASESDDDDRQAIAEQLATVPAIVS